MIISIALASCNGSDYLPAQLDSFAAQSRCPDELIVVDDCSSDNTPDIIRAFAKMASCPVRLFVNSSNLGCAQNFGRALSLCKGDLVFISDQDDVWYDSKIETMAAIAESDSRMMCFMNDALLTDAELVSKGVTKMQQIRTAKMPETAFVMGCCVAVKREFLDIVLPIPQAVVAHDNWLIGMADHLGMIRRVPEVLQYYRRHDTNVSDFFVNQVEKLDRTQRMIEFLRQVKRRFYSGESLDNEHDFLGLLANRIEERRELCEQIVGSKEMIRVEDSLSKKLDTLSARRKIRRMKYTDRPQAIAALWRQRGYRSSGGFPGAIEDLMITGFDHS